MIISYTLSHYRMGFKDPRSYSTKYANAGEDTSCDITKNSKPHFFPGNIDYWTQSET